jgi:hypothetical protein
LSGSEQRSSTKARGSTVSAHLNGNAAQIVHQQQKRPSSSQIVGPGGGITVRRKSSHLGMPMHVNVNQERKESVKKVQLNTNKKLTKFQLNCS